MQQSPLSFAQLVDGSEVNFIWDETSLYGDIILETNSFGAALASYVLCGSDLVSQHAQASPANT